MNTQSNSAQTEQNQTNSLPDFSHRLTAWHEGSFSNLIDTVNPSLERAAAIADLIEAACEPACCSDSFEPDTLWRAAQAIRLEIKDAQTLLNAWVNAQKTGEAEVKS